MQLIFKTKNMSKKRHLVTFISNEGSPLMTVKLQRNGLCHCGSGKKIKKCCKTENQYFFTGKAAEAAKAKAADERRKQALSENPINV
jgi:CDGSH-type Zn-finger protein